MIFLATFLKAKAYDGKQPVPKTIDNGESGPNAAAQINDTKQFGLF
jgi:hypothetical protein